MAFLHIHLVMGFDQTALVAADIKKGLELLLKFQKPKCSKVEHNPLLKEHSELNGCTLLLSKHIMFAILCRLKSSKEK